MVLCHPNRLYQVFFAGKSKPRCQEVSDVFLQLRISERSGRGVSRATRKQPENFINETLNKYNIRAFDIESDFIKVTIPFSSERYLGVPSEQKVSKK